MLAAKGSIRDVADLSAALQDLYEKGGSPSVRTMEQRAGRYSVPPRSTAYRIITRQAVLHSLDQVWAYLRACEVPEEDWSVWETAWTRAWKHEKQEDEDSVAPMADGPWVPFPSGSRLGMTDRVLLPTPTSCKSRSLPTSCPGRPRGLP